MISFKYKENQYSYPSSLSDVLLSHRIAFEQQYGGKLTERAKEILDIKDKDDKEIAEMEFSIDSLCKNISFFCNIPLEEVHTMDLTDLFTLVGSCEKQMSEERENIALQSEYVFNDDIWEISSPFVDHENKITFGEFVQAKEIVRLYEKASEGSLQSLLDLCIIFFRKKGEAFEESFLSKNSERRNLMEEVTMDIALSVAFFLTSSIRMFLKNFQSSQREGVTQA